MKKPNKVCFITELSHGSVGGWQMVFLIMWNTVIQNILIYMKCIIKFTYLERKTRFEGKTIQVNSKPLLNLLNGGTNQNFNRCSAQIFWQKWILLGLNRNLYWFLTCLWASVALALLQFSRRLMRKHIGEIFKIEV